MAYEQLPCNPHHCLGLAAKWFVNQLFGKATRCKLKPAKKVAGTIKKNRVKILTYFVHRITNATAYALNCVIQTIKSNASGFATSPTIASPSCSAVTINQRSPTLLHEESGIWTCR